MLKCYLLPEFPVKADMHVLVIERELSAVPNFFRRQEARP